jgi:ornithine carbamoyltransferase
MASSSLNGRDLLKEIDFTADELQSLISLAATLKDERRRGQERPRLVGKQLACIFAKTSTRTRIAFEVAMREQGGGVTMLDPASTQIGHKESVADTARVLSPLFSGIQYRGSAQSIVEELAAYADVPVYNGLTDEWHPTQMLADFLTMQETSPGSEPLRYAYVGDARFNVGNSLLVMGAIMGSDVRIVAPRSLWPSEQVQAIARERAAASSATITITEDLGEGLAGAGFVHTDIWVSMGEPAEVWEERIDRLRPYRITTDVMDLTGRADARFMHCLPAYHDQETTVGAEVAKRFGLRDGIEVTHDVFESANSIVFQQSENRMHTIKSVLVATQTDELG